jgi:hypothetical protein
MPGAAEGVANVLGIAGIEHHRLGRRSGRFEQVVIEKVRHAIAWMLELASPTA